jgi:hypothetical protein
MGYRPDLKYRVTFDVPYPLWNPEFMDEGEFEAALKQFAKQMADKYPVIASVNHKDNMYDMEPLMAIQEEAVPDAFIALQAERAIWEEGQTVYRSRHDEEFKAFKESQA